MVGMCYEILFFISLFCSFCYIYKWNSRYNVHYTCIFALLPVSILGYWQQSLATTVEQALLANKIGYLGGCFCTLSITLSIISLCKIEISKLSKCLMYLFCMAVYVITPTNTVNGIYYKHVELRHMYGASYLHKTYGPMHTVFYIMLFLYCGTSFYALIKGIRNRKSVSIKTVIILSVLMVICLAAYFPFRIAKGAFEPVTVTLVFSQVCFLIVSNRQMLYNVEETVIDVMLERGDIGVISFDFKYNFLGANDVAESFYPELKDLVIDSKIDAEKSLYKNLIEWMNNLKETKEINEHIVENGSHIYKITCDYLYNNKSKRGYHFMIQDVTAEQKYINLINNYNMKLEDEVKEKTRHLSEMHDHLVLSMASMVESRDLSTGGHIRRTSKVVDIIVNEIVKSEKISITPQFAQAVVKAAPMHDLGKITVDDEILRKPGRFTLEEYDKMKAHAAEGAVIVKRLLADMDDDYFATIAENVAHYHHERMDGSGYPCGLKGEEIPLEARIMAIADVYDALVSKRCYKERMSFEQAYDIIEEGMGTQFDSELNEYFINCREKLERFYVNEFASEDAR